MSDYDQENLCPKCGAISANYDICDTCGVIFSKVRRQPDVMHAELDPRAGYAAAEPYDPVDPGPRPWLTYIAVAVLIGTAVAGGVFIKKQRADDKARAEHAEGGAAGTKDVAAAVPTETPAEPTPSPTPAAEDAAASNSLPVEPTATPVVRQREETPKPTGKVMSWLQAVKATEAAVPPATTEPTQVAAGTPNPQPATPAPSPSASPAAAGASPTPRARKTGNIDLGEEAFSRTSASTDRVAEVMERLDAGQAPPTPPPQANPGNAGPPPGAQLAISNVSDTSFQSEVMAYSATPVLVAFYSPSVEASNAVAPMLLQIAQQQSPKVKVAIVDADASKGLRQRFGVNSFPFVVLMKNGKEVVRYGADFSLPLVNQHLETLAAKNQPHIRK